MYNADRLRAKISNGGISMPELQFLMDDSFNRNGRRFATEVNGKDHDCESCEFKGQCQTQSSSELPFSVGGVPVDLSYAFSALKAVGSKRFLELNPWMIEHVQTVVDKKASAERDNRIRDTQWIRDTQLTQDSQYMSDTDNWCQKEDERQLKTLENRWGIKDAKTFTDAVNMNRYNRVREKALEPFNPPDEGIYDEDAGQELLRGMYKFNKRKRAQF
jgi:hypothetical protein